MKHFYHLLGNALISAVANNFVWFALTYWLYLETKTVLASSIMTGMFLVVTSVSGFWFGSIVDHNKKKYAMMISSIATLVLFAIGLVIYVTAPEGSFTTIASTRLWLLVAALLGGTIAGNIRMITLPTVTTILVPEEQRDRANGMSGTVMGISFSIVSVASGFTLALAGMFWVLAAAIVLTLLTILHLVFIEIPEKAIIHTAEAPKKIDIKGTISAIRAVPGLFALIFFTTFNNFLGGVFMPLMDPYGLSLVSLQAWGLLWGFLSLGFIVGGVYISKKGLGKNPVKKLFTVNIIVWTICMFFTIQPSIVLLSVGMFFWVALFPFIEAIEHTIVQKVVPFERQGRVFGFAQSIEQAASPLTAFLIGPIAHFIFIPYMTTGRGVELIGGWFGVGTGRGIALVFTVTGIIGLMVTLIAMRGRSYKLLSQRYEEQKLVKEEVVA